MVNVYLDELSMNHWHWLGITVSHLHLKESGIFILVFMLKYFVVSIITSFTLAQIIRYPLRLQPCDPNISTGLARMMILYQKVWLICFFSWKPYPRHHRRIDSCERHDIQRRARQQRNCAVCKLLCVLSFATDLRLYQGRSCHHRAACWWRTADRSS